jgi:xylan 1,4-beta-xylosidase
MCAQIAHLKSTVFCQIRRLTGFMGRRNADIARARAGTGNKAKYSVIAARVMKTHRARYEKMSKLHSLEPLPNPAIGASSQMHIDLTMDGYTVVLLQLK